MWPFKKKRQEYTAITFDLEKINMLESLTPRQIVDLVCLSVNKKAETVAIAGEIPESLLSLTKTVKVKLK